MTAFLGELVGTLILIIFGAGVVAGSVLKKSKSNNSGWIVITIGWGLGVTMGVYAVGQFSGAHLNPAVTVALAFSGDFPWGDVLGYILAQMIGAFIGAVIVYLHYLPHWKATEDSDAKLAVFATSPAIAHKFANLLSEMIGTMVLVFGILFIGANNFTEGLNPLVVGLLIVAIGMSLGGPTGYAINPARDLGPRIAHFLLPIAGKRDSDWGYSWIPVVGPLLGGSLGSLLYNALFKGEITVMLWLILSATVIVLLLAYTVEKRSSREVEQSKLVS
ncbi:aquaporin family protein [Bacillus aquiflavi]|uniref:Aquaporin family protein n=1 Tax=Bacillus aquiflavi TaxID=2672567 RepID=A0A6B3W0N6_9BACI|nr:MIP/aquaporin family protein [Bacillus aquiflavi]MBA4536767.1 aquaporin family protein [Bacillus aquiflavi]NEY81134.1 aquaporin family protein [Bacillus aquiflavi]UAC49696.1 aquaporin family protein [Bacillus aquiflavi]